MRSNKMKRPMLTRFLAGTVLAGSLAFAAQVEAQQQGQAGQGRPERGAMGRGGRGGPMGDHAQMVDARVSRLTEALSLTAGQATAIRGILLEQHEQMEALLPPRPVRVAGDSAARGARRQRPDSAARAAGRVRPDSAERERNRAQMEALHEQTDARIEAVLSAEQRTAYRELVAKRGERGEGRPGRGGPGGGGRGRGGQRQAPPPVK